METWELEAREQIRDTITRYAHHVDGGRFDELVELFVPDASSRSQVIPPTGAGTRSGPSSPAPAATSPPTPVRAVSGTTSATC